MSWADEGWRALAWGNCRGWLPLVVGGFGGHMYRMCTHVSFAGQRRLDMSKAGVHTAWAAAVPAA